jgi:hypothetical protein
MLTQSKDIAKILVDGLQQKTNLEKVDCIEFWEDQPRLLRDGYVGIYGFCEKNNSVDYGISYDWKEDKITAISSVLERIYDLLEQYFTGKILKRKDGSLGLILTNKMEIK